MENKLDCALVRDLLPSYADGLTSNETNAAVEEHLKGCESCSAELKRMKEPEPAEAAAPNVDYLKKVRDRSTRRSLIITISLMLIGISLMLFRTYYVGSGYDASGAIQSVAVDGATVKLSGTLSDSNRAVARVMFSDSNGMVQAHVYTAPRTFFNSSDFTAEYTAASPVSQVRMGAFIVWENGVDISPITSELFSATNPFVGDMPANANIAAILGVGDQLGPFTNELQTTTEPYGWTLILEELISSDDEEAARSIMTADSYAMLAVIENLGSVTWRYRSAGGEKELTVTTEDASMYMGSYIKQCGSSAPELQRLMQALSIKRSGVREVFQSEKQFRIVIRNMSNEDVYGFTLSYALDGQTISSGGTINANGTALKQGGKTSFEFLPEDFPDGTTAIGLTGFSFSLGVLSADGVETKVVEDMKLSAKYASAFYYTLADDENGGFTLTEW